MEWNDKYRLSVEHLDQQHKGLFTAVNRIIRILDERDSERNRRACIEAVKYLKNYTLEHFADEEAYQREIAYEGYEKHKGQHDAFIQTVARQEQIMQEQAFSPDSVQDFLNILTAWLIHHIMDSDQKIIN